MISTYYEFFGVLPPGVVFKDVFVGCEYNF